MLMTEPPWSYPVTCNPAGINIPQTRQGTMQAYWPCIPLCVFPGSSANHPVNRESHSPSVANTFLPSGSRFLIAFREGANKQVISSQADSLIKISRIWADFFPANNRISLFRLFFPPFLALFPVFTEISPTDVSFGPPETGWPG